MKKPRDSASREGKQPMICIKQSLPCDRVISAYLRLFIGKPICVVLSSYICERRTLGNLVLILQVYTQWTAHKEGIWRNRHLNGFLS